jgi:hypothetical protein
VTQPGTVTRSRIIRGRKSRPTDNDTAHNLGQIIVSCARPHLLGNPFKEGEDGTREEVIECYKTRLKYILKGTLDVASIENVEIRGKLEQLRREYLAGKQVVLLCYCREDQPCHTDVIAQWIREGSLE